jgi:hypothetical protein
MAVVGLWSAGSSIAGAVPSPYVADITNDATRSQAFGLLRSAGDVGLMLGALCMGGVAHFTSAAVGFEANAALLLAAAGYFSRAAVTTAVSAPPPASEPVAVAAETTTTTTTITPPRV